MFYFISTFDFNLNNYGSIEEAEKHYFEYHVPLAKKMPGLKRYIIGPVKKTRGGQRQYTRSATLVFESRDALREAYRSEIGKALVEDENRLVGDHRVDLVEADEIV
jgi:uncharacterized protein (TIGR02118 family)